MIYHPEDTDSRRISKLEARLAKLEKKLRQMPLESFANAFRCPDIASTLRAATGGYKAREQASLK